jgi:Lon protease-like protein
MQKTGGLAWCGKALIGRYLVVEPEAIQPGEIDSLPVFPLAKTVLFPGIVIPLHVFEPRYRDMVADAMASDQLLAIAMIEPGTEEHEIPRLCEYAGVGRIIHCEKLIGGRYNILVQGMERARLEEELCTGHAYRRFRARVLPSPSEEEANEAKNELLELESCVISLVANVAETDAQLVEVVYSTTDPIKLADLLAATVVSDARRQQDLLATINLKARLAKLVILMADVLVEVGEIPPGAQAN